MAENRELALVLKLVADQFQSELKKSQGVLGDFNRFITDWKTQLLAAGGALFAIAKSTANYGEELLKTSQKVGINIEALAGLQHAASLSNLSNDQLAIGLKFLSQNMVEASRHTGDGEALFFRLGVAATDATGHLRPTEQVLLDLAEKFAQAADGAGKTEVAVKLFGRAGIELIPFLNKGKAGIVELMAEAERLGLVLSKEDAEAASRFNDELKKLQATMRGLTLEAGKPLLVFFTELGEQLRALTTSVEGQAFFRGLSEQVVLFSNLVKEAGASVQFLFGKLSFDALTTKVRQFEAEASAKLMLLENPKAAAFLSPSSTTDAGSGKKELAQLADQQKLGKALLEIFLEQNRALEMRHELQQEEDDRIALSEELDIEVEEHKGEVIVHQTGVMVHAREAARHEEQQGLLENAQAWVAYYDQLGGNTQNFLAHKTDLLRAQLAKELDLTHAQSTELLSAWQSRDSLRADQILALSPKTAVEKETIELNTMRQAIKNQREASNDFFGGWAQGMRDYVKQTGNGFNLATDMARSTAQAMESGFRTFFFDLMDNKIQSLKDVFRSLLNFTKQIIAQITAQLVTSQILRLVTTFGAPAVGGYGGASGLTSSSVGGMFGATGGEVVRRYAMGGPVAGFGLGDTVPALLTPGEFVLSRQDVGDIKRGLTGGSPIINITVNAPGGRQQSGTGGTPNFTQLARDLSKLVELKLLDEQRPGGLLARGAF